MKLIKFFLVAIYIFCFSAAWSQTTCASSAPFCANQGAVTFPASVGNPSGGSTAGGPDYGCLSTQPNPAWYHFQVSQGGSIVIDIAGSNNRDVDFICYGPFSSSSGNCGNLTAANTIDCSYSSSSTETCTIANALPGQFYTLLLTNYSNQPQNINFSQTSGTGSTNCGLLSSGVNSPTICAGASTTLTANSNVVSPTYVWSTGATSSSIVVSPTTTTVYSVTISGNDPSTSQPISTSNTGTVTVLPTPVVTATGNSPLCPGATLNLSVNAAGTSYVWSGPNAFTAFVQSPSIGLVSANNAGVYTVTVTNASGCSGTSTINISLGSAASPTLGSNGPLCAGSTLSLTATNGATSYTWTGPGGFNSTNQNPVIPSVSVSASGVYTLTTAGVPCLSVNTISVGIIPSSTVTASSNSPLCAGNTLSLTATGTATSFTWTGPGGYTSNTQNPIIPNAATSGDYTLTTGIAQCQQVSIVPVTVIPITSAVLSSNSPICEGATLNLTATSTAPTFTWTGPGGYTSNLQNPAITNLTVSGTYTLATGIGACITTSTIGVTVIPAIPVIIPVMPTVCNNGDINLNAPSGGDTYLWSGPGSYTSTVQNPTINNASVANQGLYTVVVTKAGCINTGNVNVRVYDLLNFASIPAGVTLCAGKTGTLSASGGVGGSGSYNFSWLPTAGLSNPNLATTIVTGSVTTDYTLTLTDANCPVTVAAVTVANVVVNVTPVITMTTTNPRGCEPFCTELVSTSVPASTNCVWKFSGGSGTTNCNDPNFCFPLHGTYNATLTVTDVNGCVDSVSQSAFVIVDPKPFPDFEWAPGNPTILVNEVTFTDLSTVGLPLQSWNWTFGNYFLPHQLDTSNVQNPVHLYNNVGNYTVSLEVVNSFGCKDIVKKIVKVEDEFAIYIPNAFTPLRVDGKNDVFNVHGMGFVSDDFEMSIYDRWGTLIFKTNDVYTGWDGTVKGGAKGKEGVYIYKIKVKDYRLHDREFVGHITLM